MFSIKTIIFANGEIRDYQITKQHLAGAEYFIACDGGLRHSHAMGVVPDAVIGDMDSTPRHMLEAAAKQRAEIIQHPAIKDASDLELAISYAYENGASYIKILGALGKRFDHALANLHLLAMHPQKIEIADEETSIQLISHHMTIPKGGYETLSLIPLTTEATGVITHGLFYHLNGETLTTGSSRGISNLFSQDTATITIESGLLLAIRSSIATDPHMS